MSEPYHVENLRLMLASVAERYGDIIDADDHVFIRAFDALPAPARSLFTRLVCRSAPAFRASLLRYEDVTDIPGALAHLAQEGLVQLQAPALDSYLHITTKPELIDWFNAPRQLRKPELIAHLKTYHDEAQLLDTLRQRDTWITPRHTSRIAKFELCFFGNRHQKLNEFVITELGHVVYEKYELSENTRYFNSKILLDYTHTLTQLQHELDAQLRGADIKAIRQWESLLPPPLDEPRYTRRRAHVIYHLGREAERCHQWEDAERLYRASGTDNSLERLARHAKKQGDTDTARDLLTTLLTHSHDPECLSHAHQLLTRLGFPPERPLFEPEVLTLQFPLADDAIEHQVVDHFAAQGYWCHYSENLLFNGFLGLLFWDIVFQPVPGAFANRFQRGPLDLYEREFQIRRHEAITQRLALIARGEAKPLIEQHLQEKHSLANTLVHWEFFAQISWQRVLDAMPPAHLSLILKRMLEDLGQHRAGFPDLFCIDPAGNYRLLEVKGPNDKLRENQRAWLAYFAEHGIPASVVMVRGVN
jgi:hypothetical protein